MFRSSSLPDPDRVATAVLGLAEPRARLQAPKPAARENRDNRELAPASLRRLNKCMFLEYDESQQRWRDALNRTGRQNAAVALRPRRELEARQPADPVYPVLPRVEARREHALQAAQLPLIPLWENPLVIGLLLAVCPPIGVTLAWSARSVPHAGRVALTMFGAFVMLTATLVACLLLVA